MDKLPQKPVQETLEQKFVVQNKLGLHARPAALIVQTANKFQSEITIQKGKQKINGKSIMGVMMLAAGEGTNVIIRIVGPDARKAMAAMAKLFQENFQE